MFNKNVFHVKNQNEKYLHLLVDYILLTKICLEII